MYTGRFGIWVVLFTDRAEASDQKRGIWVIVFQMTIEVWEAPYCISTDATQIFFPRI